MRTRLRRAIARVPRPVRVGLGLVALALLLWFGADLAYVSVGSETDRAAPADVILVLGCEVRTGDGAPSPCIAARGAHAAALYRAGLAPRVIASGGPTVWGVTEAAALTAALEAHGVPAAAIVTEPQARDTIENIAFSQAIMRAHGWRTAILVTEPFHINRAALIARDAGLPVYPSPATDSINWTAPLLRIANLARDTVSLQLYQARALTGTTGWRLVPALGR